MDTRINHKLFTITTYLVFMLSGIICIVLMLKTTQIIFSILLMSVVIICGTLLFSKAIKNNTGQQHHDLEEKAEETSEADIENMMKATAQQLSQTRNLKIEQTLQNMFQQLVNISDKKLFTEKFLSKLAREFELVMAIAFWKYPEKECFTVLAAYAYYSDTYPDDIHIGIGLAGQALKDNKSMFIDDIPEKYGKVVSGLGASKPLHLGIIPVFVDNSPAGLFEIASFTEINEEKQYIIEQILQQAAVKIDEFDKKV